MNRDPGISMSPKKISVIIPAYNAEPFLQEAIQSVLDQDYPDIECIVVNDGSTDGTEDVALSFGDSITYIRQNNSGCAGPPRNTGIDASTGEYLVFFDADDILLPGSLSIQAKALDDNPLCGICTTDFCNFNNQGVIGKSHHHSFCPSFRKLIQEKNQLVLDSHESLSALLKENFIGCCHAMIRRSMIEDKTRFDARLFGAEDFHFYYRIISKTSHIIISTPYMHRRIHENNATHQMERILSDHLICLKMLYDIEDDKILKRKILNLSASLDTELLWHYSNDGNTRKTVQTCIRILRQSHSPNAIKATAKALSRCFIRRLSPRTV
ncbi:glycosyltransferase family 2 protein [Fundidesulfovibrio terrae]|uniref:glycosyltransferase family 2 protein n=1 Tax=Fundidesulfovibrio terrae TaxID=2922866 RepID=UPI001FB00BFF|nr:glycosyltransferase family 2 protein [Fundidesulfovibrio terrae]